MAAVISTVHFAPTERAASNLLSEGIDGSKIIVTGNTVVDALMHVRSRIFHDDSLHRHLSAQLDSITQGRPHVLVTAHRRENHGEPMQRIMEAILDLSGRFPYAAFIVPVHPHPNVRTAMRATLGGIENVKLTEPMGYWEFIFAMMNAAIILSDSGGIQEEAATFGVPLLVLRNTSERPEAIDAGTAQLVGTDLGLIVSRASEILIRRFNGVAATHKANPFGDGYAAQRIAECLSGTSRGSGSNDSSAPVETVFAPVPFSKS